MEERDSELGMVVEESREAEKWVFKKRTLTRRDFLKLFAFLCTPPSLFALLRWLRGTVGETPQAQETRVSWITILGESNARTLWETISVYTQNLNPQTQRLTDFASIERTQLGTSLLGFKEFMDRIKSFEGRDGLRNDIRVVQARTDTTGYESALASLDTYSSLGGVTDRGTKLSDNQLREYFTRTPNPQDPNENFGLGYPPRDWKFVAGVYNAVRGRNGGYLSRLMSAYETSEPIPQR